MYPLEVTSARRIQVAFSDPHGPLRARLAPQLAPLLLVVVALVGGFTRGTTFGVCALAFGLSQLLAAFRWGSRRPSDVSLRLGAGYVDVQDAGLRSQRIRAKDLVGATTARTSKGYLLTLSHRRRRRSPIDIEVETSEEAEAIRYALGIGHGGFGEVAFSARGESSAAGAVVGRLFLFLYASAVGALSLSGELATAHALGNAGAVFAIVALIASFVGFASGPGGADVVMTAEGLRLLTRRGWFALPYANLLDFQATRKALEFQAPTPHGAVEVERAREFLGGEVGDVTERSLRLQLLSAAQRARGLGPRKLEAESPIHALRRNGESLRSWLMRLDAAGRMLGGARGYRGTPLEASDLWLTLEDPEADTELRAAAARVLCHSGEEGARVRIDAAVAAVREEVAMKRLRIAVEPNVDAASESLARIEEEEAAALARRAHRANR